MSPNLVSGSLLKTFLQCRSPTESACPVRSTNQRGIGVQILHLFPIVPQYQLDFYLVPRW